MSRKRRQRNPYKGFPERPFVRVGLVARDGGRVDIDLLADTGNPCALIVSQRLISRLRHRAELNVDSNFGLLEGYRIRIFMPEFDVNHKVIGYASDLVAHTAKASHPDFEGLAGLPFLRLLEYGGDCDSFWIRNRPS